MRGHRRGDRADAQLGVVGQFGPRFGEAAERLGQQVHGLGRRRRARQWGTSAPGPAVPAPAARCGSCPPRRGAGPAGYSGPAARRYRSAGPARRRSVPGPICSSSVSRSWWFSWVSSVFTQQEDLGDASRPPKTGRDFHPLLITCQISFPIAKNCFRQELPDRFAGLAQPAPRSPKCTPQATLFTAVDSVTSTLHRGCCRREHPGSQVEAVA